MRGRVRKLKNLNKILDILESGRWMRNYEVRDALKKMMPDLQISKRTLIRYLNAQVKMGNLEKITEPGKARYRLSDKGGMARLASMIHASMKVQSDRYPDLQRGSIILEIRKKKELFGLLFVLQEDMRVKLGERWKDTDWGKSLCRAILHLTDEFLQAKPAFVEKIPGTELFFFKPPSQLREIMTSAIKSGDYEMEADIIIHAMDEWGNMREKKKSAPITLEKFPCVKSAVEKGLFKTPKEAITEALQNLENQMRAQTS
jgi:Arc/MetJ-type ribon-helix-helix transcriptional regulator/DNA-binding HxlR family transcriptional regulator